MAYLYVVLIFAILVLTFISRGLIIVRQASVVM